MLHNEAATSLLEDKGLHKTQGWCVFRSKLLDVDSPVVGLSNPNCPYKRQSHTFGTSPRYPLLSAGLRDGMELSSQRSNRACKLCRLSKAREQWAPFSDNAQNYH